MTRLELGLQQVIGGAEQQVPKPGIAPESRNSSPKYDIISTNYYWQRLNYLNIVTKAYDLNY